MGDQIVKEALRQLAAEAATRLSSLVATGEELPFDVVDTPGEHTFYRYVPLTGRFVREHAHELRSMPSFAPACSAVDTAGVAAAYLEARGESVPEDGVERAEKMLVAFIARLWEGSAEFTLERPRLEAALRELQVEARDISDAQVLLAPLVGLQMPLPLLQLPGGVRIVRGDTVEVPAEATRSDGMQRNPWDPQFLVLAEQESAPVGAAPAMQMLRDLISVLRLFKEGGVGLGPYAFTPTGSGTWRKVATGVPATRPGGYRLSEAEAHELVEFAIQLEARPDPDGSLAWAVARFEMGCNRPTVLDGLSDQLLAMRSLFEGSGAVGADLPTRAAALVAEPEGRAEAREKLGASFRLERTMMAGGEHDVGAAMALAAWLEDAARTIVRASALGDHGSDVAASADESLVCSGLEAGKGSFEQMGGSPEPEPWLDEEMPQVPAPTEVKVNPVWEPDPLQESEPEQEPDDLAERIPEQPEGDDEEIIVKTRPQAAERDWLSEVSDAEEGETLEWPVPTVERARARETDDRRRGVEGAEPLEAPQVRHLFPAPDDTDWEIGELDYDRTGARAGQ